jgi:hypothetical protein
VLGSGGGAARSLGAPVAPAGVGAGMSGVCAAGLAGARVAACD